MAKRLFPILLACSTPLIAQGAPVARPVAQGAQLARLRAQQQVLAEEMGRLQLNMLVSDIVAAARTRTPGRAQLTMVSQHR